MNEHYLSGGRYTTMHADLTQILIERDGLWIYELELEKFKAYAREAAAILAKLGVFREAA